MATSFTNDPVLALTISYIYNHATSKEEEQVIEVVDKLIRSNNNISFSFSNLKRHYVQTKGNRYKNGKRVNFRTSFRLKKPFDEKMTPKFISIHPSLYRYFL